uniref:Uncharacterized protein n=1 Tax=Setaria viridis TaxID=4556 RepID=A0A4U6TIV7_SETVI|nr:hypothetical protein SEVIR_8G141000v2 [Setaria viridis]
MDTAPNHPAAASLNHRQLAAGLDPTLHNQLSSSTPPPALPTGDPLPPGRRRHCRPQPAAAPPPITCTTPTTRGRRRARVDKVRLPPVLVRHVSIRG